MLGVEQPLQLRPVQRHAGRQEIEDYDGVAGLYVWDLDNDSGYGIRPDEQFFAASTIKIPIMVAVYRKVDEGELEFSQQIEIKEEDWAAGAGCSSSPQVPGFLVWLASLT
jgi:beta-lactamase class A